MSPYLQHHLFFLSHIVQSGYETGGGGASLSEVSRFTIGAWGRWMNSVEAKVARAREHFTQVQHEIDTWLESGSFTVSYERNEACDEHYLKANLIGAAPNAARWALMLGDGMTNLRDSLDHLIYQISNPNLDKPQYRKAAFVIVREAKDFKREANNKLAGVSKKTRAVVEAFQPYNRPHQFVAPSLLGLLADFANTNKHRLLLPVFTIPQNLRLNFDVKTPSRGRVATMMGNIEDGSRFFVYRTDVPEPGTTLTFPELKTDIALIHETTPSVPAIAAGRSPTRHIIPAIGKEVEDALHAMTASL